MPQYTPLITLVGQGKIAAAIANGPDLDISHLAVGDGSGAPVLPLETMTELVNEVWRGTVESVVRDPVNPTQVIVTTTIPAEAGPFMIREAALFTLDGQMIAIQSTPEIYKSTAAQGAVNEVTIDMVVVVSTSATVIVVLPPDSETIAIGTPMLRMPFISVDSLTTTAPPASPVVGATYAVPAGATGAWVDRGGQIVSWSGTAWLGAQAAEDTIIGAIDQGLYYRRVDGAWAEFDFVTATSLAVTLQRGGWKQSVRVAAITNLSLSGVLAIDNVNVVGGDRVLVAGQTNAVQNGIYVVASGAWARATDFDETADLTQGAVVPVREGTSRGDSIWMMTTDGPVVGTSLLAFTQVAPTLIPANSIDASKFRQSAGLSVVGRPANSTGNASDIVAGSDGLVLRRDGTTIGFGQIGAAALSDGAVTAPKFRQSAGLSVVGRAANSTGAVADIAAATNGHVLRRDGTTVGFGQIGTAALSDGAVTDAKAATMAAYTLKARNAGTTGAPSNVSIPALTDIGVPADDDDLLMSDTSAAGAFKKVKAKQVKNPLLNMVGAWYSSVGGVGTAHFAYPGADTDLMTSFGAALPTLGLVERTDLRSGTALPTGTYKLLAVLGRRYNSHPDDDDSMSWYLLVERTA